MCNIIRYAPAGLVFAAHSAAALELDTLLPPGLPGLGEPPLLGVIAQGFNGLQPSPFRWGGASLAPEFIASAGYDSAPNGDAAGAGLFSLAPSLTLTDVPLGFGAYAAAHVNAYAGEPAQDVSGYTVALGEAAVFPAETFSFAAGLDRSAQSAFGLTPQAGAKPLAFSALGLSVGDKIALGMFTVSPRVSYTVTRFDTLPDADEQEVRGSAELEFSPGGPLRAVGLFQVTRTDGKIRALGSTSYAALAGVEEDETGLWEFRLLAGAAWRTPASGRGVTAPVLEAAADWLPTELDEVSLQLAHEIDDPEQIGPAGYTLSEADLSVTHQMRRTIQLSATARYQHAAYFGSRLTEDVFGLNSQLTWRLNRALALSLAYAFNGRQANLLRAANEHAVTIEADWTP